MTRKRKKGVKHAALGPRASEVRELRGPRPQSMTRLVFVALAVILIGAAPQAASPHSWDGIWSFDLCHEDRKGNHEADSYCRQGLDRLIIERGSSGRVDIRRCPGDPWGESRVSLDPSGRTLRFTTPEGLEVRVTLGDDGAHFKGSFRSSDGHSGRAWGRRAATCG